MAASDEGTAPCGECFALVPRERMDDHLEWHTWVGQLRRAGPILDDKRRRGESV